MEKDFFERRILPILNYVGGIGASIMCVAYVCCVFVLINGFEVKKVLDVTVFSIITAAVGFVIMQFLKIQGISFAKSIPENKEVLKQYYSNKTKDKKYRSINYFWITSVLKDVFIKAATLVISTIGIIMIVIEGSNDYNMLLLAFVNLLMFICFGMLSLAKAYEFFNNRHIPYIKEQLRLRECIHEEVEVSVKTEGDEKC